MADDPRPILRELAADDRRGAVWCAALCAQSVLHLVPEGEDRPSRAVELALDYGRGVEISAERMRSAASSAEQAAAEAAAAEAAEAAAEAAAYAAYAAVYAAVYAADASAYAADAAATAEAAADAAAYAATSAAEAAAEAADAASGDAWERARAEVLARLSTLVRGQLDPIAPSPADVRRARPEAQVAWDWMLEHSPEPVRIGSLGDALDRARRLGLRWDCPVERAVAERHAERMPNFFDLERRRG